MGSGKAGGGFGVLNICGNIGTVKPQPLIGFFLYSMSSYVLSVTTMDSFAAIGSVASLSLKGK